MHALAVAAVFTLFTGAFVGLVYLAVSPTVFARARDAARLPRAVRGVRYHCAGRARHARPRETTPDTPALTAARTA